MSAHESAVPPPRAADGEAPPSSLAASPRPHFQRLDVLRAIAILLVFWHHYYVTAMPNDAAAHAMAMSLPGWAHWLEPALFLPLRFGYFGVHLFFVISGFCIHGSWLNWRAKRPGALLGEFSRSFFQRRFWRIVPPYFIALLVSYLVFQDAPFSGRSLRHLLLSASLFRTLFPGFFYDINAAYWSVAIEWQLYLLFPLLLMCMRRWGVSVVVAVTWIVAFIFTHILPAHTAATFILNLPFRWWFEWTLGVLIADRHFQSRRLFPSSSWLRIGLLTAFAATLITDRGMLGWFLGPLFFGAMLESCVWSPRPLGAGERALVPLGLCSYSFYLLHVIPMLPFWNFVRGSGLSMTSLQVWFLTALPLFAVTFGISWWSYRWVEMPSVKLGQRLA